MNNLQSQLKTVSKSLADLSKRVEKITNQIEKSKAGKKAAAANKAAAKRAAPAGGKTVLDTVFDVVKRSKKGVTITQLKTKTNLNARQLSNALYKLSQKGMVQAPSRGLYVKK